LNDQSGFPIIGRKVVITPFVAADITDNYLRWLNDPEVTRFSNQRFKRHDHDSAARYLNSFEGSPNLFVTVRRRDNQQAIGTMTAYVAPQHGTADVGILIGDRHCWGQGFGQDAWDSFIHWLLGRPGMRKVTAGTSARNVAMIRLAERSGMTFEGLRLRQELIEGEEVDILYYGRFRAG